MDFSAIIDNFGMYLGGLVTTIELVGLSLAAGLLLAVPLAVAQSYGPVWLRWPVFAYSYFFRGTPLLVQIFLIYYGLGQFEAVKASFLWPLLKEAYWCALIAFALNTGAYTCEILRGAIKTMAVGEVEAARACGMSTGLMLRRIVLPSAFRRALPAYSNEVIFMLHGSSLASVITLLDITGVARLITARFYNPFEAFITAGALYMALTFLVVWLFKRVEKRWFAHLRPLERPGTRKPGKADGDAQAMRTLR